MPPQRGLSMFAPVTYVKVAGANIICPILPYRYVLYPPLGMSDKEEGGEAVLRPLALPSLRSPLFPQLAIFI